MKSTEIIKKLESYTERFVIFLSKYTSYLLTITVLSAGIGGVIATLFALYFFDAVEIKLNDISTILLKGSIIIVWLIAALQFGLFFRLGFRGGFGDTLSYINKYTISFPRLSIRSDLSKEQYEELFQALYKVPKVISYTINFNIFIIIIIVMSSELITLSLDVTKFFLIIIVGLIAMFIVTCFTLVISEVLTGKMREKCMDIMHEKKISVNEETQKQYYSTVKTKMIFFLILFFITLFVSNTIVYMNKSNVQKIYGFSMLAVIVSTFMAYLIFYIIYSSLKQIEKSSYDLMTGGNGNIFLKSVDEEFLNLARSINVASNTIKEYQHGLEIKVQERTKELNQTIQVLAEKEKLIQTELDFAANIQQGILPAKEDMQPWNGLSFTAYYQPMGKVSGDYFDVFKFPDQIYLLLADASGHGVPAALVTMTAKQAFSSVIHPNIKPADIYKEVNKILAQKIKTSDYMTCFLLRVDESHKMTYSNASHPKAIHYIHSRGEYQLLDTNGMFIGAIEEADDFYEDRQTRLQSGDRVYLITDGFIEHKNLHKEEFGLDRLLESLSSTRYLSLDNQITQLVDALKKFMGNAPIKDDISLLSLEIEPNWSNFIQLYNSGIHFLKSNKFTDALYHFLEAKKIIPNTAISYQLALVYYQMSDYDTAKELILTFLKEKPNDTKGLQLAINIYLKTGNKEEAKKFMQHLNSVSTKEI
jgi:phosphoserine phosphatase RsbU/P